MREALRRIEQADRNELVSLWVSAFGCPAPRNCQATLLRSALAWHRQMQLSKQSARSSKLARPLRSTPATLSPGTQLLREWQGQTHKVLVLTVGFEYAGARYKSLSAIARHITGTPWSGPLFFGLRS